MACAMATMLKRQRFHTMFFDLACRAAISGALFLASSAMAAHGQDADDASSMARWKDEIGTFRLGFAFDSSNPKTNAQYERFRQVLEDGLNMPVEVFVAPSMPALIDAQASGRVDYSALSALAYDAVMHLCECVQPLAQPVSAGGANAFRSVLVTRADTDAVSMTVAVGPDDSLTGAIIPRLTYLAERRSIGESDFDMIHVSSADESIERFLAGEVDALFGWAYARISEDTSFDRGSANQIQFRGGPDTDIVWQSPAYRFGPHVVSESVPLRAQRVITSLLLSLHANHPLAFDEISGDMGGPMEPVEHNDYAAFRALTAGLK